MLSEIGILQVVVYLSFLCCLVKPLGWYMAQVYEGKKLWGLKTVGLPIEQLIYRLCAISPQQNMNWKQYLSAVLIFNGLGIIVVYLLQMIQAILPFNPQHLMAPSADLALNVAVSFVTNTNWQAYAGETTMSYMTQMLALTTQNFFSAATGMSVLIALIRGIRSQQSNHLGNFWVDMIRSTLYILLPLALILACFLVSQGVIQNLHPNIKVPWLQQQVSTTPVMQTIPMGPVASQVAIKQLGTNGGGFFNANAAHPFENPTPLSNFFEALALLLIPAALCMTFGIMVRDKRQGWAIFIAMVLLFIPSVFVTFWAEQQHSPALVLSSKQPTTHLNMKGGNMEGKESRFGIAASTLWSTATTASGNGSVNSMLDSYSPSGTLVPLWLMLLGEVVFGGVGSGLFSMLMLVIITVFVAGLMIGRTPEYLGKKIEPFEMKMASLSVLIMPFCVLLATAVSVLMPIATSALPRHDAHGLTEIFYNFVSMANNNGSALAGLASNNLWYNLLGCLVMFIGRFGIIIPVLAIAGRLAQKKILPYNVGTLTTHTPLFILLLMVVIILIGALSFLPALALGPVVEQLMIWRQYVS